MANTFDGCTNLEYVDIINFNEQKTSHYSNIFNNVLDNIVICLNENNHNLLSQMINLKCYTIDCTGDWKSKQKKNNKRRWNMR